MDTEGLNLHGGKLVVAGSVESYEFRIYERSGFRFNDTKVVGPITLRTRLALYRETLPYVVTGNYFGMLDNSEGFENDFPYEAIRQLDEFLIGSGLKTYYGATVTKDGGYSKIIKLAQTNMETIGLDGLVVKVPDRVAAQNFIFSKIDEFAAARER